MLFDMDSTLLDSYGNQKEKVSTVIIRLKENAKLRELAEEENPMVR